MSISVKEELQKLVFGDGDRILGHLEVMKHQHKGKKGDKGVYICITTSSRKLITINYLRRTERGDFKTQSQWFLTQLKRVNTKDSKSVDFELEFEKVFSWSCNTVEEKMDFLNVLYHLCLKYRTGDPPAFEGQSAAELRKPSITLEDEAKYLPSTEEAESFQIVSDTEQRDLERVLQMSQEEAISAENLVQRLYAQLAELESKNVQDLMVSDQQADKLMTLIDRAIAEADRVDQRLAHYDWLLRSVAQNMDSMGLEEDKAQVRNKNYVELQKTVQGLMKIVDFPEDYLRALEKVDFTNRESVQASSMAAAALLTSIQSLRSKLPEGLEEMHLVRIHREKLEKVAKQFAQAFSHHLNSCFVFQGNRVAELPVELKLVPHAACYNDLMPFCELVRWMKIYDVNMYDGVRRLYCERIKRTYEREMKGLFQNAARRMDRSHLHGVHGAHAGGHRGSDASIRAVVHDRSFYQKCDEVFEALLCAVEPIVLQEEQFCMTFFHMAPPKDAKEEAPKADKSTPTTPKSKGGESDLRLMMCDLFSTLEHELQQFTLYDDKELSFMCLSTFSRMTQHCIKNEQSDTYLRKLFGTFSVQVKRNLDRCVDDMIREIHEFQQHKYKRVGMLPFVRKFIEFVTEAEIAFKGSQRRTDLERAYSKLLTAILEGIVAIAKESQKQPPEVIMFESYNHLYDLLSRQKIAALETERKELKKMYQDQMVKYVHKYLGHPLDKLHRFFEGVKDKVAQGVKMEEIGYQLAFSQQELRKVIREYPGKEVKKGLDSLFKKVEKHVSEEENMLLQVVWRQMQEDFLRQYKEYEELIRKCYPGSNIKLEFSIEDVLQFFQDIAQSH